ncbi:MAG: hypothetical protein ABEI99_12740 [Halobaculum sp.]
MDDADDEASATEAAPDDGPASSDESAESAPEVELGLYQISVRVVGSNGDGLDDVEETARSLVDHLVETAETLEDEPDQRGLG